MKNKHVEEVEWSCRFHPTEWFHEVGCPHQEWTKEDLLSALITRKKSEKFNREWAVNDAISKLQ